MTASVDGDSGSSGGTHLRNVSYQTRKSLGEVIGEQPLVLLLRRRDVMFRGSK